MYTQVWVFSPFSNLNTDLVMNKCLLIVFNQSSMSLLFSYLFVECFNQSSMSSSSISSSLSLGTTSSFASFVSSSFSSFIIMASGTCGPSNHFMLYLPFSRQNRFEGDPFLVELLGLHVSTCMQLGLFVVFFASRQHRKVEIH